MSYKHSPDGYAARIAALVALLVKAPRTESELHQLLDYSDCKTVGHHLQLLRNEGLVYVYAWRQFSPSRYAKWHPVYAWQPAVCEHEDAPKPSITRRTYARHAKATLDQDAPARLRGGLA